MIDRYNCEYCNIIGENDMCEATDGEWVKFDDIKHLLQNKLSNSEYKQCGHDEKYILIKAATNELFCIKCNRVVG